MTDAAQGTTVVLVLTTELYPGGPAADAASLTITITSITDGTVVVPTTSTGIVHVSLGVNSYGWAIAADLDDGPYLAHWAGTIAGSPIVGGDETVNVVSLATATWATASEVYQITGITPDGPTLARAQGDVEISIGRTIAATMSPRDTAWVKRAVAWQAAWLPGQPGSEERVSVSSVSQDGVAFTYTAPWAVYLAPRAAAACKRLSWMGTRSQRIRPRRRDDLAFEASYVPGGEWSGGPNFLDEASDDEALWTPYDGAAAGV